MAPFARRTVTSLALLLAASIPLTAQLGPAPAQSGVAPEILELACAPSRVEMPGEHDLVVTGGQAELVRTIYAPGDLVTINGGTNQGIEIGQEFFVRRLLAPYGERVSATGPAIVQTSGWIRVWAVDPDMSLATITHACDPITVGDYLEPLNFATPALASTSILKPESGNYGRVLYGNDRREAFGRGDFFVVDRGSAHGVEPGARFIIYRERFEQGNFLFELGEAVAVDVRMEDSTLQAVESRSAFLAGDYVAMRPEIEP